MPNARDQQVDELVRRAVAQAPAAPPFPVTALQPSRRTAVVAVFSAGVAIAAVVAVSFVLVGGGNHGPRRSHSVVSGTSQPTVPRAGALVRPESLAVSPDGTLYVGDATTRRIVALTANGDGRVVAHVDGGLAFDKAGNLYVAEQATNTVWRVAPDGTTARFAGTGKPGFSGDGGLATKAKLSEPLAVTVGSDGAVSVVDTGNERVRRIAADGTISTVAGNGAGGNGPEGLPATHTAMLPRSIAIDGAGNMIIANESPPFLRRIASDGIASALPGEFTSKAMATAPDGAVDVAGYGTEIRRVSRTGALSTLAYNAPGFRANAIAVAPNGDIYVAEAGDDGYGPSRILRVQPDGRTVDVTPRGTLLAGRVVIAARTNRIDEVDSITGAIIRTIVVPPSGRPGTIDWVEADLPHGRVFFGTAGDCEAADTIWSAPVGGGTATRVTTGENVAVSPDGTQIAFARIEDGCGAGALVVRDLRTRAERIWRLPQIAGESSGEVISTSWSSDGRHIAYTLLTIEPGTGPTGSNTADRIYVLDTRIGTGVLAGTALTTGRIDDGAITADGRWVMLVRDACALTPNCTSTLRIVDGESGKTLHRFPGVPGLDRAHLDDSGTNPLLLVANVPGQEGHTSLAQFDGSHAKEIAQAVDGDW